MLLCLFFVFFFFRLSAQLCFVSLTEWTATHSKTTLESQRAGRVNDGPKSPGLSFASSLWFGNGSMQVRLEHDTVSLWKHWIYRWLFIKVSVKYWQDLIFRINVRGLKRYNSSLCWVSEEKKGFDSCCVSVRQGHKHMQRHTGQEYVFS